MDEEFERDESPVPFRIVASWPIGTFLENIAVREDGSIVVSSYGDGAIHCVGAAGESAIIAQLPQPVTGIIVSARETYICSGSAGKAPWSVVRIDEAGELSVVVEISDALLLNGFTPFRGDSALVVDSYLGAIFEINLKTGSYRIWLQHALLAKSTVLKMVPGANGIKCFDATVFVTNTDSAQIINITVRDGQAEYVTVLQEKLAGDDFAIDREGALYIATHSQNGLVKLSPRGERTLLAGPHQGMAGATACAFGRTAGDLTSLYVTTTGGLVSPYKGQVQRAKLVRLEVGVEGQPLPHF
jgi:hypothetical protein